MVCTVFLVAFGTGSEVAWIVRPGLMISHAVSAVVPVVSLRARILRLASTVLIAAGGESKVNRTRYF